MSNPATVLAGNFAPPAHDQAPTANVTMPGEIFKKANMNNDLNQRVALRLGLAIIGEEAATVRSQTLQAQLEKALIENKRFSAEIEAFKNEVEKRDVRQPADTE